LSWRRSFLSALRNLAHGAFADTASVRTGAEVGSNFSTIGARSSGEKRRHAIHPIANLLGGDIASFSNRKAMMTCETPSDEFDRSS
jgi:hypothetical protein